MTCGQVAWTRDSAGRGLGYPRRAAMNGKRKPDYGMTAGLLGGALHEGQEVDPDPRERKMQKKASRDAEDESNRVQCEGAAASRSRCKCRSHDAGASGRYSPRRQDYPATFDDLDAEA